MGQAVPPRPGEDRTLLQLPAVRHVLLISAHADTCLGSTDVAVPFSRLADLIEVSKREMDELELFASVLGHIGDGNFHESIMYNSKSPGEREKVQRCVENMVKRALDMEGTCTGEHSIGWGKKESLRWEVGLETLAVMRAIKQALDPLWIMNPGKIMDVPCEEDWQRAGMEGDVVVPIRRRSATRERNTDGGQQAASQTSRD